MFAYIQVYNVVYFIYPRFIMKGGDFHAWGVLPTSRQLSSPCTSRYHDLCYFSHIDWDLQKQKIERQKGRLAPVLFCYPHDEKFYTLCHNYIPPCHKIQELLLCRTVPSFCWKNNWLALKEGSLLLKNPTSTMFSCFYKCYHKNVKSITHSTSCEW